MKNKKRGYVNIFFITITFAVITIAVVTTFIVTQSIKSKNINTNKQVVSSDTVETEVEILKVIEDEESYITIVKHMDHEHIIDSKEIYEYAKDKIGESVKGYSTYDDSNNNHTIDMILK